MAAGYGALGLQLTSMVTSPPHTLDVESMQEPHAVPLAHDTEVPSATDGAGADARLVSPIIAPGAVSVSKHAPQDP